MPSLNYEGIISVNASTPLGYKFFFEEGSVNMVFKETLQIPIKSKWNLYFLNSIGASGTASKRRTYNAWHDIMGHLHQQAMLKLPEHCEGITIVGKGSTKCEPCI